MLSPTSLGRSPVMSPTVCSRSWTIVGTSSTNSFTWSMNVGMMSARTPATTARPASRVAKAPTGRGTPWRSSRVAPADSGIAMMIVISTASSSVAS